MVQLLIVVLRISNFTTKQYLFLSVTVCVLCVTVGRGPEHPPEEVRQPGERVRQSQRGPH